MIRPVWFLTGVGAGIYAVVKARRAADLLRPEGWQDRMAGLQRGWQVFADEVRTGMDEKETELRERLLIGPDGPRALPPGTPLGDDERLEQH